MRLNLRKNETAALFEKADKQLSQNNYSSAISILNQIIEIDSQNAAAWNKKGFALGKWGKDSEALDCFNKALEIKPDFEKASENQKIALERLEVTNPIKGSMTNKQRAGNQSKLDNMSGHEFESFVEELIKRMGFSVDERKLTADGGVDILAHSHEPLFEGKYIIQCKRYNQKVPEAPVRDLYGVVHSRNANKGILITNSDFTRAARDFAEGKQIELIDGAKLKGLLSRYDLFGKEPSVSVSEATAYLFNNFAPLIKKQRQTFENIETGYFERRRISGQQYVSLAISTGDKNADFEDWWVKTMDYFVSMLHEKPLDYQRLKEASDQLVAGLQKFFDVYKTFIQNVPPDQFLMSHKKNIICYKECAESIFQVAEELERMSNLPIALLKDRIDADGVIRFNYSIGFSRKSMDEASNEFSRACGSARRW
jgi:hypothetical protein